MLASEPDQGIAGLGLIADDEKGLSSRRVLHAVRADRWGSESAPTLELAASHPVYDSVELARRINIALFRGRC